VLLLKVDHLWLRLRLRLRRVVVVNNVVVMTVMVVTACAYMMMWRDVGVAWVSMLVLAV